MTRLSIIVPTLGRPTLSRTLESMAGQLEDADEVLVVGDGPRPEARRTAAAFGGRARYLEHRGPEGDYGHALRNWAMPRARGDVLAFMDDDDVYTEGALGAIRRAAGEHPGRPLMFRMQYWHELLWRRPVVEDGNVSTQMIVVPNEPQRLGRWAEHRYNGDLLFCQSTLAHWPEGSLVWREEVIARVIETNMGRPGAGG